MKIELKGLKTTKRKRRKILVFAGGALVIIGGVIFMRTRRNSGMAFAEGAITTLTAEAVNGTISNSIIGSGNLQKTDAEAVNVPAGLKVVEILVESGDSVAEGDPLAVLDLNSINSSLAIVQNRLNEIDKELNGLSTDKDETVSSYISGRVKAIYAKEGDLAAAVVLEHGSVILLSVDGKMAVDIEAAGDMSAGDSVKVELSGGTIIDGTIASVTGSSVKVTVTDNGTLINDSVTVKDTDGNILGAGNLYVNQAVGITASSGTIKSIKVSENTSVSSGSALFTVTGAVSAEYQDLIAERLELVENMQTLLTFAQDNTIKASFSGTIETVNITEGQLTGSSNSEDNSSAMAAEISTRTLLTVAAPVDEEETQESPAQTDEPQPEESIGITEINEIRDILLTAPVTGESPQSTIGGTETYTGTITWEPAVSQFQQNTVYRAQITLHTKDIYQFSASVNAASISPGAEGAAIDSGSIQISDNNKTLSYTVVFPETQASSINSGNQDGQMNNGNNPGTRTTGGSSVNTPSINTGSISASASAGTAQTTESSYVSSDIYSETTAFTMVSDESMQVTMIIDELDILSVSKGQEVNVTLDAVDGEFTGEVVSVSDSASGSGSVVSYTAKVNIPKAEGMLAGMSVSATIIIDKKEDIVMIPVNAVQEMGNRVFVYTQGNEETNTLSGEVEIETGLSDGDYVEIINGLSAGDRVYYNSITVSSEDSSGFIMDFGGMNQERGNGGFGGDRDWSQGPPDMGGGMPGGQ